MAKLLGDGWLSWREMGGKLVARLVATAALWVRISQKYTLVAYAKSIAITRLGRQKVYKKACLLKVLTDHSNREARVGSLDP